MRSLAPLEQHEHLREVDIVRHNRHSQAAAESMKHPAETVLESHSSQMGSDSSILVKAAKVARSQNRETDPNRSILWDAGATVTGPLVYLYATWVIQQALDDGIDALWFLARDGYFPYLAVRNLLEAAPQVRLTAKYIYGSRVTYGPLEIGELGPKEWKQLITHAGFQYSTVIDIQRALFCEDEVFQRHLYKIGFSRGDWKRPLRKEEIYRIKMHALDDERFNQDILRSIEKFQSMTHVYFNSEGLHSSRAIALVDSGWTAKSHYPLYRFLRDKGCPNVKLFYFGLESQNPRVPLGDIRCFMFNRAEGNDGGYRGIYYPRPVETLLMTNQGRTRSFERDLNTGKIIPVTDRVENPQFLASYFDAYESGIMKFMAEAQRSHRSAREIRGVPELATAIINRFWLEPTPEEVRVWSQLSWEWDPLGTVRYPLARPYRLTDSWLAFRQGRSPDIYKQFWRAGAEKLTPHRTLKVIQLSASFRRFCVRLVRRFRPTRADKRSV